jgi:hypothetical protein
VSKTVVIHQPDFFPYLGFFHRFLQADLYVVLDHVQFVHHSSRSWTHRDKIKTRQGEKWLTASVAKAPRETSINRICLSTGTSWKQDNLDLLRENYRLAPFFGEIMPRVEEVYGRNFEALVDFNLSSIALLSDLLDTPIQWIKSSTLAPEGRKSELLLDLLRKVGATKYLSGVGARDYLDETLFRASGIPVIWQSFRHPIYPQQFGDFVPYLSSLDMLFNCGVNAARGILRETK